MPHGMLKVWNEEQDGLPVVRAEGEIDLASVDAFRIAAAQAVEKKPQTVLFDLREVRYIDSSGLGVLVAARRALGDRAGAITVYAVHAPVRQALEITGLMRVLTVENGPSPIPAATVGSSSGHPAAEDSIPIRAGRRAPKSRAR